MPKFDKINFELTFSNIELTSMIEKVMYYDENAFIVGCGRETMEGKFYDVFGVFIGKTNIRNMLNYLCDCGVIEKIKEKGKYTRFIPRKRNG